MCFIREMPATANALRSLVAFTGLCLASGAFAIRPRQDGTAEGIDDLREFLYDVIEPWLITRLPRARQLFISLNLTPCAKIQCLTAR